MNFPAQGYGQQPQQGYAPQPGYGQAPQQGYGAPQQQAPQPITQSVEDFWAANSGGGSGNTKLGPRLGRITARKPWSRKYAIASAATSCRASCASGPAPTSIARTDTVTDRAGVGPATVRTGLRASVRSRTCSIKMPLSVGPSDA